ncbi:MAG: DNA-processing protein DprA [Pseudomonadota bacterium]
MPAENFQLITINDPLYPQSLKTIDTPPKELYIAGSIECLSMPGLAIVGTRKPTIFAQKITERWAKMLSDAGIVIVSGLALGIDGAAHRGALLGAAKTIAVLGCGLNHEYPKQHAELRRAIIDQGGCVISEHPPETPPRQSNFPRRNRIISGLSYGVLVMEAAMRSGSLITARLAIEQGKEVMAVPGSLHNPMAEGCHWLIREGATLVTNVEEIGACLRIAQPRPHPPAGTFSHREKASTGDFLKISRKEREKGAVESATITPPPKEERAILEQIHEYVTPIDEIVGQSRLAFHEVCSILVRLEISGYIEKVVGGYIKTEL